ncbi:AAA family ATPase [Halobacterium hubeiense]|uniref:AAA family ATPase n=1 Tax=Halobacterium hubeiense TaxID=1407499 RepID=UPI000B7F8623|nr:AAA family ATPase [Halobacterium hubeiense]
MTEIERLHLQGFKPIENLEVSAKSINIITGRNNTGKTSFLEGVDLAFNPQQIERFKSELGTVVNAKSDQAEISATFYDNGQTDINQFGDNPNIDSPKNRRLIIHNPTDREAVEIFNKNISNILEVNEDYPVLAPTHYFSSSEEGNEDEFLVKIQDALQEAITEFSNEEIIPDTKENSVIMGVDGESYAYSCFREFYPPIRRRLVQAAYNKVAESMEKVPRNPETEEEEERREFILNQIDNRLAPRFGADQFVDETPPSADGVQFIDASSLESADVDMNKENAAVRVSDIEDYLIESDILENLEDFSFDKLVFKEEGEKYEIPYSYMGDGFRTLVGILWEVLAKEHRGNVLLLEEPGVHMHPGYIENLLGYLVKIIRRDDLQVFLTTHSIDLIEGFFSDNIQSEEEDFLKDNFQVIQMTDPVSRTLDYEQAQDEIENLNFDLRGV